jgi:hypothetical protein
MMWHGVLIHNTPSIPKKANQLAPNLLLNSVMKPLLLLAALTLVTGIAAPQVSGEISTICGKFEVESVADVGIQRYWIKGGSPLDRPIKAPADYVLRIDPNTIFSTEQKIQILQSLHSGDFHCVEGVKEEGSYINFTNIW